MALDLARWQFAFTTINHFFFVPVTIGLAYAHRDGFAFTATTTATCIVSVFVGRYPNVMVSSTNPAYSLTVHNTASDPYSLKAMTVVVLFSCRWFSLIRPGPTTSSAGE